MRRRLEEWDSSSREKGDASTPVLGAVRVGPAGSASGPRGLGVALLGPVGQFEIVQELIGAGVDGRR